jgi:hypothetical protein
MGRMGVQNRGLDLMLYGALCLLRDNGIDDAFQLLVHLTCPIGGGCGQCAKKCSSHRHVLAGTNEGGEWSLRTLNRCGPAYLNRRLVLVQVNQSGLNGCSLIGKLATSLCGFAFDVVLQGMSSFLLVGH